MSYQGISQEAGRLGGGAGGGLAVEGVSGWKGGINRAILKGADWREAQRDFRKVDGEDWGVGGRTSAEEQFSRVRVAARGPSRVRYTVTAFLSAA
ncbi:hypothetical protein TRAPUB_9905 [Trametes pubescens]|uniref:Uncharacterized protein n=1 Tax=Trametes pubescens TaxID=154538 RepID=A0A1M2W121_TRAPU|nr:hypothetical protein TRAPUB_9905 [Trametes pubescens]